MAGCGTSALIKEMVRWVEDGAKPETFPAQQRDSKESVSLLVVPPSGPLLQYETTPFPLTIEDAKWAIGSGRDFAVMAMRLGKTAAEAVELACEFCHDCGNGVDFLVRGES
jgi:ATP-dependent protease HslVU (ClpYQ) peptidase subunit